MIVQQSDGCFKKFVRNNESGDFTWLSYNRSCSIVASFTRGEVKRLEQNIPLFFICSINCKWRLLSSLLYDGNSEIGEDDRIMQGKI